MTHGDAETWREPRDYVAGSEESGGTVPDRYWNHEEARWSTVREAAAGVTEAGKKAAGVTEAGEKAAHEHTDAKIVLDEEFWEDMYRSRAAAWSGRPNPQLLTETSDLAPGTALDVGCGEGADAVWLAQRGWQVTAVDISPTALQRAERNAVQAGSAVAGRITWLHADLTADRAPEHDRGDTAADQRVTTYDLVTAQFMHLPSVQLRTMHARLAAAVSPGGILLVVGHHPSDMQADVGRRSVPDLMYTADQVAETLDPRLWEVLVSETRPRTVTHAGEEKTAHDTVLTARRR